MKIAFAAEGEGISASLAYHFGRCPYYVFVELESNNIKSTTTKKNPFFNKHEEGSVPKFIAGEKAKIMITGGIGPKAIEWFDKLGIIVITAKPKELTAVLKDYLDGKLSGAKSCRT
ncbi:NifB/NifX family molybdenum-iron cluster-binding protein [Candidatus Woesearchaeota archaeon]|jgi:predicted Fe-Mo cluster-binding NifX family protein|nr:NifB/NifX family molybdenum-iron cluster-binding protein [Candidatus Woesearchaeota archaeon]MBT7062825.1 NifB/NifX family molybdenum-iron cluster-binding protein [Candidatus Woesearchaeota archaeon]MBT7402277.1 NifB/NifX family molybdenum-iron cluster-binding protein [Candidatus Woesearchaeota archaeon]